MSASLVATRRALHALATRVVSPLRVQLTGHEIALEVRPGGFGTPPLPDGGWAGVAGLDVVRVTEDGTERRAPITTLRAAAELVGLDAAAALPDAPLPVDAAAAARLAGAWAGGETALRALLAEASPTDDRSPIRLWPEHFDVAAELGEESTGRRATYGVSPGDDAHPEPYAYVGPWAPLPASARGWDAVGFTGAETPAGEDAASILAFFRDRRDALVLARDGPPAS